MLEVKETTTEDMAVLKAYMENYMDRASFGNTDFNRCYALALACMQEQIRRQELQPFPFLAYHDNITKRDPDVEGIVFANSQEEAEEKIIQKYGTGCVVRIGDKMSRITGTDDIFVIRKKIPEQTETVKPDMWVIQRLQKELFLYDRSLGTPFVAAVYAAIMHLLPDGTTDYRMPEYIRIHDIIRFLGKHYGIHYAENSRETVRKAAIKPLMAAGLVIDNGLAKTSPNFGYKAVQKQQ